MHRGRITEQGSPLVRRAAVEAVQHVPGHTRLGQIRDQVGARPDRDIGVVAVAREPTTLDFWGLRDGHIRCLPTAGRASGRLGESRRSGPDQGSPVCGSLMVAMMRAVA